MFCKKNFLSFNNFSNPLKAKFANCYIALAGFTLKMLAQDFKMQIFLYPLPSVGVAKWCTYRTWPDLRAHRASILFDLIQSLSPTWLALPYGGWKILRGRLTHGGLRGGSFTKVWAVLKWLANDFKVMGKIESGVERVIPNLKSSSVGMTLMNCIS